MDSSTFSVGSNVQFGDPVSRQRNRIERAPDILHQELRVVGETVELICRAVGRGEFAHNITEGAHRDRGAMTILISKCSAAAIWSVIQENFPGG